MKDTYKKKVTPLYAGTNTFPPGKGLKNKEKLKKSTKLENRMTNLKSRP